MAKKKKEMNYKDLTMDELQNQLHKSTEELFKLRFRSMSAPPKNNMSIRNIRREVARINTFIGQRRREK